MSLKSWKEEFYPCAANSKEAQEKPVAHSLRKWKGALPENLERHGMERFRNRYIISERGAEFEFDAKSCALCERFIGDGCEDCPVMKAVGYECYGEFSRFLVEGDPKPMVELLEKTAKKFPEL